MYIVNNIIFKSFRNHLKFSITSSQLQLQVKRMSNKCTVAVVQLTASNNKEDNLNSVKKLIGEAVEKNAKVRHSFIT